MFVDFDPAPILRMIVAQVPRAIADAEGRKTVRAAVDVAEGALELLDDPYGHFNAPQLHRGLRAFAVHLPAGIAALRAQLDEVKRQLSAYDDVDGVKTFR